LTGLYWRSLQAGNTGNALTENAWWTRAWHELEKQSDGGAVGSHTATTTSYTELDRYITPALNTTVIPAGDWKFLLYSKITAQSGQIKAEIYRVNSAGVIVGSVLGTAETTTFISTSTVGLNCSVYIGEKTGWSLTDRIGIIVSGKKIGSPAATLTWYHDMPSGYGSAVETPLTLLHNQMNGLNEGDYKHLTTTEYSYIHSPNADTMPLGTPMTDTDILAIDDAGKYITFNNADARNITVPKNVFPAGTEIFIEQIGAGVFTLVAEDGNITVNGNKKSGGQFCVVGIYFRDATTNANIATVIGGVA
jgi:3D (Asp-Asp-Asp) domain-containing protein